MKDKKEIKWGILLVTSLLIFVIIVGSCGSSNDGGGDVGDNNTSEVSNPQKTSDNPIDSLFNNKNSENAPIVVNDQ